MKLDQLQSMHQNPKLNDEYEQYYHQYYNQAFEYGKGTEDILNLISSVKLTGTNRWLDLGSGSMSLFWSIPLLGVNEIYCVDINPEAFYFLELLKKRKEYPQCYYDVLKMFDQRVEKLHYFFDKLLDVNCFDALNEWPRHYDSIKFDLITQFGLFGLCEDKITYLKSLMLAWKSLSQGGTFIGANWKRKKNGCQYLDTSIIQLLGVDAKVQYNEYHTFEDDPEYDGVLIWQLVKVK